MLRFVLQRLPWGMQAGKDDKAAMAELFGLFKQHYQTLSTAFMYYSCGGSSDTFHMSLNQFTSFLEDCKVCTLQKLHLCLQHLPEPCCAHRAAFEPCWVLMRGACLNCC